MLKFAEIVVVITGMVCPVLIGVIVIVLTIIERPKAEEMEAE